MDNTVYKTFARNSALNFINALVANFSLFFINICLARLLPTDEYAIVVLVTTIVGTVLVLANFGITDAITRYIAQKTDKGEIGRIISSGGALVLSLALGASILVYAFSVPLARSVLRDGLAVYLEFASVWIFFVACVLFVRSVGMGLHRMSMVILGDLVYNPPKLVYLVFLWLVGVSVFKVIMGWTILAFLALSVLVLSFAYFMKRENIPFKKPSITDIKNLLHYGKYLYMPFLSIFMIKYILTLQLGILSSKENVSYMEISMSLVTVSFLLFVPVSKILMPTVSRIYVNGDFNKIGVISKLFSKYMGTVSILVASVFCFGSKYLIGVIYGGRYTGASMVLVLLAVAIFFETFKFCTDPFLIGTEHARIVSRLEVFRIAVIMVGGFFLVSSYGALGAAATFLASSFLCSALKIFMLKKKLSLNIYPEVAKISVLFVLLIGVFALGLSYWIFLTAALVLTLFLRLISIKEIKTIYQLFWT